jgi:hypothetical protein
VITQYSCNMKRVSNTEAWPTKPVDKTCESGVERSSTSQWAGHENLVGRKLTVEHTGLINTMESETEEELG